MENQNKDEVDVYKILSTLWLGKWKILSFIIIPVAVLFIYESSNPKNITSSTLILPMSKDAAQKYEFLSLTSLSTLTSDGLYDRFVAKLQDVGLLREAVVKSNLVNIENYENEKKYMKEVSDIAFKIKIKSPVVMSKPLDGAYKTKLMINDRYSKIVFNHDNNINWIETLSVLNSLANQAIKEDIDIALQTAIKIKKIDLKFKKESAKLAINNALSDYDILTENKLLYLEEQSKIARSLGIATSTIKAEILGKEILEVPNDRPFYLNGYEAIEKEIELIKQRKNKEGFVVGLLEKQQIARKYDQDIELERLEMLTNLSDIYDNNFTAGTIDYKATQTKYKSNKMLFLLIILVGAMTGALFVLFSDGFQKRKKIS